MVDRLLLWVDVIMVVGLEVVHLSASLVFCTLYIYFLNEIYRCSSKNKIKYCGELGMGLRFMKTRYPTIIMLETQMLYIGGNGLVLTLIKVEPTN